VLGASSDKITDSGARLSSVVTPNFGETIYGFEFGETFAYGDQVLGGSLLPADTQSHPVQLNVTGLKPGQTYHYRALAINFGGITYSPDQTFTTLDTPKVISETSSNVTSTSARLGALVAPSLSPTSVHFEYGPNTSYGSATSDSRIGEGSAPVLTGADVSGLAPLTEYHFRAVATNAIGTEFGPDQKFNTAAGTEGPPPPQSCRSGFVRRGEKCVRRPCRHGHIRRHGKCVRSHKQRHKRHRHASRNKRRRAE
jgi:hypothetical protein